MSEEQHHIDFNKAFKESGCTYFPNSRVIRQYKGAEFWKIFQELGHDKADAKQCKCGKNV